MILKGWKSIGKHLGVHHCTARRWHLLYQMPISAIGRTIMIDEGVLIQWVEKYQREIQKNPKTDVPA